MSLPLETEAVALAHALRRVGCTADEVMTLSLLDRLMAASIALVENPTDAHWVLVRKLLQVDEVSSLDHRRDERWVCGDCGYQPLGTGRPSLSCPGCRGDFTWTKHQ